VVTVAARGARTTILGWWSATSLSFATGRASTAERAASSKHYIDLEATRPRIEHQAATALDAAREALHDAQSEVLRKQESLARVERDYLDGKLPVEKWEPVRTDADR
jgi:hypothetical protein